MAGLRAWRLGAAVLVDIGLACCTLEFESALTTLAHSGGVRPVELGEQPAGTPVVVAISGTVTDRLAPSVLAVIDACRAVGPTSVIAFGACASSGGPYWDSYAVTKGIDQLIMVDRYVAGCPPTPQALLDAVAELVPAG